MNIISLFNSFLYHFSNILDDKIKLHDLESKIYDSTNELNLNVLKDILENIDLTYKQSKKRKKLYSVKDTRSRTLITSLGLIEFNKTYYKSKIDGKYYSYLEDYLGIDKWAKMTLKAEVNLINNSIDNGMSWASTNTIPNYSISRQTISKKIKNINYNYVDQIERKETPNTLYIEADEVHSNLQRKCSNTKKNKVVPVILTHEGHKEDFVKKKQLKGKHYIASSLLKTDKLWNETYKYLDNKYDLNKVDYLFISGDGASWIKNYDEVFPNAIFILDKFHYRKALNCIFKKESLITSIADDYLRHNMIREFKQLVSIQLNIYSEQKTKLIKYQNYLLKNIEGIINQKHPKYKCPCSMEGHISNYYAKRLTSRPHAYSDDGLENTVQLLTMKANNIILTEDIYCQFKYGESTYKKLNLEKYVSSFRLQANQVYDFVTTSYPIDSSSFNLKDMYRLNYFLNKRL